MRLSFHTNVPAPVEEVFEYITAFGADGPLDRVFFVQKYGEIVEEGGSVVLTRDTEEDDDVLWRSTFNFPSRRTMEALESPWADREDVFETVRDGTRWTVTFIPKTRGLHGLVQYFYFQAIGKYRVGVPVLSPVVQHFRRKARGEPDPADEETPEAERQGD